MGACPECGAATNLNDDVVEGEIIECEECGAELEVVSINPLELALAPEEEEDWGCLFYTSPSPRDQRGTRMPSSA